MPGVVEPELYTRWLQFGAFSPILRTHTTKNPDAERRIWAYPEPYSDIMRGVYHLRYALLPYIYTEARRTYDTGVAFLHPLYYDWPEAAEAYTNKNEYVFGADMIVCPGGCAWRQDHRSRQRVGMVAAGRLDRMADGHAFSRPSHGPAEFLHLARLPVYVRAGAIVPEAPPMQYSNQKPLDPLIVNVFPLADGQSSTYTLYEDAGDSTRVSARRGRADGNPRSRGREVS